jgi:hypothetical protein
MKIFVSLSNTEHQANKLQEIKPQIARFAGASPEEVVRPAASRVETGRGSLGIEAILSIIIDNWTLLVPILGQLIDFGKTWTTSPIITLDLTIGASKLVVSGPAVEVQSILDTFMSAQEHEAIIEGNIDVAAS